MTQATLNVTKDLILRLWSTMPESKDFGKIEYVEQCSQQPDLIRLGRKKHTATFSLRSLAVTGIDEKDTFLDWREIQ